MKEDIIKWIDNIQQKDGIPPKEVIAFNFGIFENESGYVLYLVGSFDYDVNDDDWASLELPVEPYRYLNFPTTFKTKKWDLILSYCSSLLSELETEGKLNIPLLQNAIAITTGFDDGDLIKIR